MKRDRDRERGSALVLVLLITLVLLGLGLVALRRSRTGMLISGSQRTQRQAYQVAYSGLVHAADVVNRYPPYFHAKAVTAQIDTGSGYVVGAGPGELGETMTPPGVFPLESPFPASDTVALATGDSDRLYNPEYQVTISNARFAEPAAGYQQAGGQANPMLFYKYRFDSYGWVGRESGTLDVETGSGGARKRLRAEVRIGPVNP